MPPLTPEGYKKLCEAAQLFSTKADYSLPEADKVMEEVFGPYQSEGQESEEGIIWAQYWVFAVAATELDSTTSVPEIPHPPTYFEAAVPDASTASPSSPVLNPVDLSPLVAKNFSQVPQDVKEEHERRRLNGNISEREKKNTGAPQDTLLNQLVIVRNQEGWKKHVWCIGCLDFWASLAADRTYPHAQNCSTLQHAFHSAWSDATKKLGSKSAASVAKGEGEAPALRTGKRKVEENEDHGRVPVPEELRQGKITKSFGPAQLTPQQQSRIDFFLLWFLVCCALAWALLDNGFFIDFINAL
ncbi:hypothetical protein AAF712_001549 [Marasmius tenuissimus]|uniref:Uncharacterized protein n=1 Tax=Marasmius tenuissimus TaxID=585030 RepID=A0ABR3AAQ1_9AGAR